MRSSIAIVCSLVCLLQTGIVLGQNLFLQENAAIYVQEEANLSVGGDLQNEGFIENLGKVSVSGSFLNNSIFSSATGELAFLGSSMQQLISPSLELDRLTIDGESNVVVIDAELIIVTDELEFINGVLKIGENAQLIIEDGALATGGNENSYFDGELIQIGTGFKYYPIGNNGLFAPITLEDIKGIDVKMRVSVLVPNAPTPEISDDIIGVSEHALWRIQVDDGEVDSALITIDFNQVDLENFTNKNDIIADTKSPVVVKKDAIDGTFVSLGVSELTGDEPAYTNGRIVAESYIKPTVDGERFVAIGLAPLLPERGFLYVPDAFSPNAIEEENKTFRVFGVKVLEEDFELRIFDRANVLLYETNSYREASEVGWDGTNGNNGNESPSGLYYYTLKYRIEGGEAVESQSAMYLIR